MDGDTNSPTRSVAEARKIYRVLERKRDADIAARAAAVARGELDPDDIEPLKRIRLATDRHGNPTVDYSKAEPGCTYCGGTGRRPDQRVEDEEKGEVQLIPVVCRCVHRNGGVARDMLDRILAGEQPDQQDAQPDTPRR